jgi:hypothetical protein
LLIEGPDTLNGVAVAATTSGGGSAFRGLHMESLAARPSAGTYAANATSGIKAFAPVFIYDCSFEQFTKDGIELDGTGSPGVATNVDGSYIHNVTCRYNGRDGLFFDGTDAQACTIGGQCDFSFNNNWGVYDSGFLNNTHLGHHAAANGVPVSAVKHDGLTSVVTYPAVAGSLYTVALGQAVAAATTQPGTNANVWCIQKSGAGISVPNSFAPLWVNGTSYKEGGSYFCDGNGTIFLGCYAENGQGQPYMGSGASMRYGQWEKHPLGLGAYINVGGNGELFDCNVASTGRLTLSGFGWTHQIGPVSGVGADVSTAFNTVGAGGHKIPFYRWNVDGSFNEEIGYIWPGADGAGTVRFNAAVSVPVRIGGNAIAAWVASGLVYQADKGIKGGNAAAPSTGAHLQGEIVYNSAPAASGKVGWVCVAGGTPGTWKPFGAIDA